VNTFLKMLFDTHALWRFDTPKEERKRDNLIVLWADEAQRFVTALEDGMSRLRLRRYYPRGAGHHRRRGANLPPHLSRHSAATKPGSSRSICNRVIFKAADEEGALESADFIGKAKMIKKSWGYSAGKISRNYSEQEEHRIWPGSPASALSAALRNIPDRAKLRLPWRASPIGTPASGWRMTVSWPRRW
jgi:hypothetical protein